MTDLKRNHIEEVAALFGKKPGVSFVVDDGTGYKPAEIRFSYHGCIERYDGRMWQPAEYFLEPLVMGRCWEVKEYKQENLFRDE